MLAVNETKIYSTGFINFLNQQISNISNIYNPNEKMGLVSQIKCDNMFLDPKLDHIFSHFSVTNLVYILFLLVCGNYPINSKMGRCSSLL